MSKPPTDMPIDAPQPRTWTLAADRRTVRMELPPLPVAGLPEPLKVHLDFDAASVDAMLQRLTELRIQMLPPPTRQ